MLANQKNNDRMNHRYNNKNNGCYYVKDKMYQAMNDIHSIGKETINKVRLGFIKKQIQNHKNISTRVFLVAFLIIVNIICGMRTSNTSASTIQKGIAQQIIRFHVIANSDTARDQEVKLKVKNEVVKYMSSQMSDMANINEARAFIVSHRSEIEKIANGVLLAQGFTYHASVSLEQKEFPIKIYGDITLPPGRYEALCIRLGESCGQNWWCIVFPTLCFVDSTYSVVPEDKKEQLQYLLTDEEYDSITSEKPIKIKAKFKLYDWFQNLLNDGQK